MSEAVPAARRWLERYLAGDVDGAELEEVKNEDLLFLVTARVEIADPDWLRDRLSDDTLLADRRLDVYRSLRTGLRHHLRHRFSDT